MVHPSPPADLVVIGHGVGGTAGRGDYPFERTINQAQKRGCPGSETKWRALVFASDQANVSRAAPLRLRIADEQ